jgi:general secretion pathway protein I
MGKVIAALGRRRPRVGFTLVEVVVALGLLALAMMMVLGLIPAGIESSQRASDVQGAAAWSHSLIEQCPAPTEFPIPGDLASAEFQMQVGPTLYSAVRTVKTIGPYLYRIEVQTTWDEDAPPVHLSLTRFNPAGPES